MQFTRIFLFLILLGSISVAYPQKNDLKTMIENAGKGKEDTARVNLLIDICDSIFRVNPDEAIRYGTQALELAGKIKFLKGEAYALKYIGMGYFEQGEYEKTFGYFQRALEIFETIKNKKGIANMLSNIGVAYNNQGNDPRALELYLRSLNISEEINDSLRVVTALINIGLIYSKNESTQDKAQDYYLRALRISEKLGYQIAIGTVTVNLGELLFSRGDDLDALSYFERSLKAYQKAHAGNIPYTLINIGKIYAKRKDFKNAVKYQEEALSIAQQTNSKLEEGQALLGLANTWLEKGDTQNALRYFKLSEQITNEIGANYERRETFEGLARTYAIRKDFINAYRYKSMESTVKDTLLSETRQKQLNQLQFQHGMDNMLKENEALKNDARLKEARNRMLSLVLVLLFLGIICTSAFLIVLTRTIKQKKKVNAELVGKNALITLQKQAITDSILYAKRIQNAILPPPELISNILPESVIIFRPRDIVSGDFYWVTKSCERVICIAADCTGHGVPGALMSMLGISFLNEIISRNPRINAAEMLGEMRKYVVKSLRQNQNIGETKDGMDVALLIFNEKMTSVEYAGANNPLFLIRDGHIMEYKSNKMPIGIHLNVAQAFSSEEIEINKGDMLYIFSDGYVDQFGGPNGKKFMIKNLKKLLVEIHNEDLEMQKMIIENTLDKWMGKLDQVDDILLMGIRV